MTNRADYKNCEVQIAAVLLQLHIRRREIAGERGLLLVLGCSDWQRKLLTQELQRLEPSLPSEPGALPELLQ
jgi:hypothetical protein